MGGGWEIRKEHNMAVNLILNKVEFYADTDNIANGIGKAWFSVEDNGKKVNVEFLQTADLTRKMISLTKYGEFTLNSWVSGGSSNILSFDIEFVYNNKHYKVDTGFTQLVSKRVMDVGQIYAEALEV